MWLKKSIIYFCFWHHKLSRLLPTNLASDSNLFLIEFVLRWPMIILCGFWFLSCSSLQMSLVFLSITGSEKGLSNFPETLRSTASNGWYDERDSYLSVLRALRIPEFDWGNLKRVYHYLLSQNFCKIFVLFLQNAPSKNFWICM